MSMFSCEKCWDTPCECGWEYRNWSMDRRYKMAAVILGIRYQNVMRLDIPDEHPMKESVKKTQTTT